MKKRKQVKQVEKEPLTLYEKIERSKFCDYLFWSTELVVLILGVLFFVLGDYYKGKSIMSLVIVAPVVVLLTKFVEDKFFRGIE